MLTILYNNSTLILTGVSLVISALALIYTSLSFGSSQEECGIDTRNMEKSSIYFCSVSVVAYMITFMLYVAMAMGLIASSRYAPLTLSIIGFTSFILVLYIRFVQMPRIWKLYACKGESENVAQ